MNIEQIVSKLPYEAYSQITDCYCPDHNKDVIELTLNEVVREVKWTIERLKMDISEASETDFIKECRSDIRKCERFLKKYGMDS